MEYKHSFLDDIECFSLIDYFQKSKFSRTKRQIFFQTSFFEEKSSRMINLFKDTGEFYEFFSFLICDIIKDNIKFDLKETVFIPLPSSTKTKYEKRYYNLCYEISKELPLINGYNYINITSDCIEAKNGDRSRVDFKQALKLQVSPQKLERKNIILFDDILTTGNSIKIVTKFLRKFDVKDIKVITLGKTYDSLIRGKFEYYLNKVNNSNDSNKKKFFDFSHKELNPKEEILRDLSFFSEEEKTSIIYELLKLKNEKIDDSFTNALKFYKDCLDCENLVIVKENISLSTLLRSNKETIKDWYGKFCASNINEKLYKKGFLDFSDSHYSVTPLGTYFGLQTQVKEDYFYPIYSPRGQAFILENLGWIMELDDWNEELFHSFEVFSF